MELPPAHPEFTAWSRLVGSWEIDARHPMLPGDAIRGRADVEWLEDQRALVMRAHYDHPDIPDSVTLTAVLDGTPTTHYVDVRGFHRTFEVSLTDAGWRYWNDHPTFAQRFTATFSEDGSTITGVGERREDGAWILDIELGYRRVAGEE